MRKKTLITLVLAIGVLWLNLIVAGEITAINNGSDRESLKATSCKGIGVFANINTNCIQLIDPALNRVSPPYLKGYLGTYTGGLLDVALTHNGNIAIVSNYGDNSLFFIDISGGFDAAPTLLGTASVGFPAEDLAITPDDRFVLVTDGAANTRIAVINIATRTRVFTRNIAPRNAQSVAIAADGQTVVVGDYTNGGFHTLLLTSTGRLNYSESYSMPVFLPVNVAISPDGKTVIGVLANRSVSPIFRIDSPGHLTHVQNIALPARNGQTCVFSSNGQKAYYITTAPGYGTQVHELNVNGPGLVSATGVSIDVFPPRSDSSYFGVECIGLDPAGHYLYVTNSSDRGALATVEIIDLYLKIQVGYLQGTGMPSGIDFACKPL